MNKSLRDANVKKYLKKVQTIFPQINIGTIVSLYTGDGPASGKISLSHQSDAFKALFKFAKHKQIIHYTSLDALFSILNTQTLRLYNCLSLNDPKEIEYANSEFAIGLSGEHLQDVKQNNFVVSFCEYDMKLMNDDFNMWRLYGSGGDGVGLVFEIKNIEDSWKEAYMGKVCYGTPNGKSSVFKKFQKFIKVHQEFNDEHQLFENTPSILSAIALHFKDEIWKSENEIRLFAHCPFDEFDLKRKTLESQNHPLANTLEHVVNNAGQIKSYVSLPLNFEKKRKELKNLPEDQIDRYLFGVPHLKLKRIVFGYNVSYGVIDGTDKILKSFNGRNTIGPVEIGHTLLRKRLYNL